MFKANQQKITEQAPLKKMHKPAAKRKVQQLHNVFNTSARSAAVMLCRQDC
jgi:hypothetical protein